MRNYTVETDTDCYKRKGFALTDFCLAAFFSLSMTFMAFSALVLASRSIFAYSQKKNKGTSTNSPVIELVDEKTKTAKVKFNTVSKCSDRVHA